MNIKWEVDAWKEYSDWQQSDKAILRKINQIIKDIQRNPFDGVGKPEPLKHTLSGYWSRRIDHKNRLVYRVENNELIIVQCYSHYNLQLNVLEKSN